MEPLAPPALTPPAGPPLGVDGERCTHCDAPLSVDQRYCLNCGSRRAAMRLPFIELVGAERAAASAPAPAPAAPGSALVYVASVIALLLALGIGVLLGRGTDSDPATARAPIVTVAAPAAGAAPATQFTGDWPSGTEAYTISLVTLPATATAAEIAQAKQDATGKGAPDVGALKSDEYASLTPQQIVVYSGTYTTRKAATRARSGVRSAFPGAKVVRVSTISAGAGGSSAKTPAAKAPSKSAAGARETPGYGKSTKKLPDKIVTEGPAPPVDKKAPGGGSGDATEIG